MTNPSETVDLTNCDREPIHIPGAILPHGAMLVVDPETEIVEQAAGDLERLMGKSIDAVLGRALPELVASPHLARLREAMAKSSLVKPRALLDPLFRLREDRPVDASLHRSGDCLVIELEEADLDDRNASEPLACVQDMVEGLDQADTLEAFCNLAATRVREVAKYDRVMVYRFLHDDCGWVFAESRRADLAPFLDLHYPASDIPRQARALYLTSWIRLITEVNYVPAPLTPSMNPRTRQPLDMSHAVLRDVSPIHREYLRNMGVEASMSISILKDRKLWGLIACHNYTPRRLPRHLRAICELFGSMFSLQLEARERSEALTARLDRRKRLMNMMQNLASDEDYATGLVKQADSLLRYLDAGGLALRVARRPGGVAMRVNEAIATIGDTPDDEQIAALTDWLSLRMTSDDGVFKTDRLGELWPGAKAFAGVGSGLLAISISRDPRDFILWFRPEVVQTVTWGGNPSKPVQASRDGDRLTPRKSFEAWSETVRGRATPWTPSEEDAAFDMRVSLLEVVLRRIDAAARERLRAYEHERMLMAELDHRVKNTLANIQALVSRTGKSASSLEEFTDGLNQRIKSMSRAHSLLTEARWEGVSMLALMKEELEAYARVGGEFACSGLELVLTPKAALSLSLAMHELATNAAKYGAFSTSHGRVSVDWAIDADGGVGISWKESGGPRVAKPKRRGFGSTLIERALALETGGQAHIDFLPEGIECAIRLPDSAVARILLQPGIPVRRGEAVASSTALDAAADAARRILVVEDSALVGMVIEDVLTEMGWTTVGPATTLDEALALARDCVYDAALLDVNMHGKMSWPVADLLTDRGISFVFTTGYEGSTILPERFARAAILNKPFEEAELVACLKKLPMRRPKA